MLKLWQPHCQYTASLLHFKSRLDSSSRIRWSALKPIRDRLRLLDLDQSGALLSGLYPPMGRPAVNQPQIIRSFILLFLLHRDGLVPLSLTRWVSLIKEDPLFSALIGCPFGTAPPLGSYYDFMNRLWAAPASDRYSRNKAFPSDKNKSRPQQPKGKGEKAPESKQGITRRIGDRFMSGKDGHLNFERFLQEFFFTVAVFPSMNCGLIPSDQLTVSGDGTAVHTHASPFGKSLPSTDKDARMKHFSDPDADWGWDSDIDKYYFGYTLYHLSCYNETIKTDLPLCLRFFSARRHDSVSFLLLHEEFRRHCGSLKVQNICLDSAHDNYHTYELMQHYGIRPFIDLNTKRGRPETLPPELAIDKDGTPLCQDGHRMVFYGYDASRHRLKWRCPAVMGKCDSCPCPCSPSPYGRVIYTKPDWDIRLYTPVTRGTDEYKNIYKMRTCTERINNRILNDYGLHRMVLHTVKRYSFMATIIGICIHLDARYKQMSLLKTA